MNSVEFQFQDCLNKINNTKQEKYIYALLEHTEINNPTKNYKLIKKYPDGTTKDFGLAIWRTKEEMFEILEDLYSQYYS